METLQTITYGEGEERGEGLDSGRSRRTIRLYLFSSVLAKKREIPESKYTRLGAVRAQICSGCRFCTMYSRNPLRLLSGEWLVLFSERQEPGLYSVLPCMVQLLMLGIFGGKAFTNRYS